MNEGAQPAGVLPTEGPTPQTVRQHIVEIVSDSGEGAQKAGQALGAISAKMGNGVWTVEIIPAEIKPPARSKAGASGIRIRIGATPMTNMGDQADLVVAFNEQVLYGRIDQGAYRPGTKVLLESRWKDDRSELIREQYAKAVAEFEALGFEVFELALDAACQEITGGSRVGKNMFVLGLLSAIYDRDLAVARKEIAAVFGRKGQRVIDLNHRLLEEGYAFALENVTDRFYIPAQEGIGPQVVMNGNQAVGLGVMASGMDLVSMYPITPATSASHHLASVFHLSGGFVHQAEDEIAAIGFAIGSSFAGRTACTITSGPGLALKTEFVGLAVMCEIPLVIVLVQRGGPSTGLPTKVEQGDLLASLFGAPGDAPKVVMAAATIGECFHLTITARKLAEEFRTPVILLTDANLATGVAPFDRPVPQQAWLSPPPDQSDWDPDVEPYAWDPETGLSPRPVPGQAGGEYVLTGLAHTRNSKVAYDPESNQIGCEMRSRKMAALQRSLRTPEVYGGDEGDLLLVGWGSTLGSLREAVDRGRAAGHKVSTVHLRFLFPMEPGLDGIFERFEKVMTIEINYGDPADVDAFSGESRRLGQLAQLLRSITLVDIDSWATVPGQPLSPSGVYEALRGTPPAAPPPPSPRSV